MHLTWCAFPIFLIAMRSEEAAGAGSMHVYLFFFSFARSAAPRAPA